MAHPEEVEILNVEPLYFSSTPLLAEASWLRHAEVENGGVALGHPRGGARCGGLPGPGAEAGSLQRRTSKAPKGGLDP